MKINIHCNPNIPWHVRYSKACKSGMEKHGLNPDIVTHRKKEADLSIIMGPNCWKPLEKEPFIMFNRKFLGMGEKHVHDNVAISYNGFNGYGEFPKLEIDKNRLWKYINEEDIFPWTTNTENSWLCYQSDLGRCTSFKELTHWYGHVQHFSNKNIIIRTKKNPEYIGVTDFKNQLQEEIKIISDAHILNSTFSVELLQHGIPVISWDKGDPCYAITKHDILDTGENLKHRLEFFHYLSHCQWHINEIKNGTWWSFYNDPTQCEKLYTWKP